MNKCLLFYTNTRGSNKKIWYKISEELRSALLKFYSQKKHNLLIWSFFTKQLPYLLNIFNTLKLMIFFAPNHFIENFVFKLPAFIGKINFWAMNKNQVILHVHISHIFPCKNNPTKQLTQAFHYPAAIFVQCILVHLSINTLHNTLF